MNNIPDTDQWLLGGKCTKCRRASYCTKKCTAHKNAMANFFHDGILAMTGLGPIYNELNRIKENGMAEYDDKRRAMQYEKNKINKKGKGRTKTC